MSYRNISHKAVAGNGVNQRSQKKKNLNFFYSSEIFYIFNFFILCSDLLSLIKESAILYFLHFRIFFYTQLTFVFHLLEDFYIVHDHTATFCFFLLWKDFYIVPEHIDAFLKKKKKKMKKVFYCLFKQFKKLRFMKCIFCILYNIYKSYISYISHVS